MQQHHYVTSTRSLAGVHSSPSALRAPSLVECTPASAKSSAVPITIRQYAQTQSISSRSGPPPCISTHRPTAYISTSGYAPTTDAAFCSSGLVPSPQPQRLVQAAFHQTSPKEGSFKFSPGSFGAHRIVPGNVGSAVAHEADHVNTSCESAAETHEEDRKCFLCFAESTDGEVDGRLGRAVFGDVVFACSNSCTAVACGKCCNEDMARNLHGKCPICRECLSTNVRPHFMETEVGELLPKIHKLNLGGRLLAWKQLPLKKRVDVLKELREDASMIDEMRQLLVENRTQYAEHHVAAFAQKPRDERLQQLLAMRDSMRWKKIQSEQAALRQDAAAEAEACELLKRMGRTNIDFDEDLLKWRAASSSERCDMVESWKLALCLSAEDSASPLDALHQDRQGSSTRTAEDIASSPSLHRVQPWTAPSSVVTPVGYSHPINAYASSLPTIAVGSTHGYFYNTAEQHRSHHMPLPGSSMLVGQTHSNTMVGTTGNRSAARPTDVLDSDAQIAALMSEMSENELLMNRLLD